MAAEHWFRSHHGAPTDPKWIAIAARAKTQPGVVAATWWALMDHASQNEPRGSAAGFDAEAVAAFFGWPEDTVAAALAALRDKKLIGADDMLAAWDKRQPKREDAGAAERKRRERERKAEAVTTGNVTQSHTESRAVPLEERRGETEREGTEANASGASPRESEVAKVVPLNRQAFRAVASPAIREHWWQGRRPPATVLHDHPGYDEGRDCKILLDYVADGRCSQAEALAVIPIARPVLDMGDVPFTGLLFVDKNHGERWEACLSYVRKRGGAKSAADIMAEVNRAAS